MADKIEVKFVDEIHIIELLPLEPDYVEIATLDELDKFINKLKGDLQKALKGENKLWVNKPKKYPSRIMLDVWLF